MSEVTIDLEKYRTQQSKVFTGRERGIHVRTKSKLVELEKTYDQIIILIPEVVMSINPSFLEELLYEVVQKLGKKEFNRRITFKSDSKRYDIADDLDDAIDRILRKGNALSK
jgi:hypothetical protein